MVCADGIRKFCGDIYLSVHEAAGPALIDWEMDAADTNALFAGIDLNPCRSGKTRKTEIIAISKTGNVNQLRQICHQYTLEACDYNVVLTVEVESTNTGYGHSGSISVCFSANAGPMQLRVLPAACRYRLNAAPPKFQPPHEILLLCDNQCD